MTLVMSHQHFLSRLSLRHESWRGWSLDKRFRCVLGWLRKFLNCLVYAEKAKIWKYRPAVRLAADLIKYIIQELQTLKSKRNNYICWLFILLIAVSHVLVFVVLWLVLHLRSISVDKDLLFYFAWFCQPLSKI